MDKLLKILLFSLFATLTLIEASTINASIIKSSTQTKIDRFCTGAKNQEKFCMEYKVNYPIISSQDKHLQKQINQAIKSHIDSTNAKKYVLDYLKETGGDVFSIEHSDENSITLLSITENTFSLKINYYTYLGGAHGNYGTNFVNYSRKTGDKIKLDKLFTPNYREKLIKIAEKIYRDSNGIMPNETLGEKMGWFEDKFILPSAIGIGKDGLHLEYNPYEIRAYVYGSSSLLIPFSKLSSITPKNSPIANLVF